MNKIMYVLRRNRATQNVSTQKLHFTESRDIKDSSSHKSKKRILTCQSLGEILKAKKAGAEAAAVAAAAARVGLPD